MRAFAHCLQEQTFPEHRGGAARTDPPGFLGNIESARSPMEPHGGYERDWAKTLRESTASKYRIVDPKRVRQLRPDRPGVWPRTMRLTRR